MFIHHAFLSNNWYIFSPSLPDSYLFLGKAFKFCVPIFAFLSGWFYAKRKDRGIGYSIKKALRFYFFYIISFLFISALAVGCCHWRPSLDTITQDLFPVGNLNLMVFCWYVTFFPIILITFSILDAGERHLPRYLKLFFTFTIISAVCSLAFPLGYYFFDTQKYALVECSFWIPCAVVGFYLSKSKRLSALCNFSQRKSIYVTLLGFIVVYLTLRCWGHFASRTFTHPIITNYFSCLLWGTGFRHGVVDSVTIITLMLLVNRLKWEGLRYVLRFLGKLSMNLWFTHCLFFSSVTKAFFQPFMTFIPHPISYPILMMLLCIPPALFLQRVQQYFAKKLPFLH